MWYKVKRIMVWDKQVRPAVPVPTSWLLWYRPLQSDLKDASWNWKDWSWYSGTGTFSTNAGKTGARVTFSSSSPYLSSQHVVTTLNYQDMPITICWWICFNQVWTTNWDWLMSSSNAGGKGCTMWTRPWDNYCPTAAIGSAVRISSAKPTLNTWYFWCATREWTTMKTYFNWTLANTITNAESVTPWWVWKLWCAMVDGTNPWNSWTDWWIRHCAVYNRALTATEVLQFYNQTK